MCTDSHSIGYRKCTSTFSCTQRSIDKWNSLFLEDSKKSWLTEAETVPTHEATAGRHIGQLYKTVHGWFARGDLDDYVVSVL